MQSINELANTALDAAYLKTAGPMLKQISAMSRAKNGQMQRALFQLDETAAQYEAQEKPMPPDDPALTNAQRAFAITMTSAGALIAANDNAIQEAGQLVAVPSVTGKVFRRVSAEIVADGLDPLSPAALKSYKAVLSASNIKWTFPTALDFATNYVESEAWVERLNGWGPGYVDLVEKIMLDGIRGGWGPKKTAQEMRRYAQGLPISAAENLTRTLQLTSYRDACLAMEKINGAFIEYKIRIAKLDTRTCLSCVGLHGTRLEVGERIDDHYRGRCSEFYVVPGGPTQPEFMQADGVPGQRRFVPYQTGEAWFASLPQERQEQQRSFVAVPAKLRAYRDGVPLSEFIGEHQDDVFGRQVVEKSLVGAIGSDAEQYYSRNQHE